MNDIYTGWKPVTKEIILEANRSLVVAEYFNSFIVQRKDKMLYKFIGENQELVIIKLSPIMGFYNAIRYCATDISQSTKSLLSKHGFTLRGSDIIGKEDAFGCEFVYNSDECLAMKGKKFSTFRNVINTEKDISYSLLFEEQDILKVIQNWSIATNSKHQIKLFESIKENKELCNFTTLYLKNKVIGFSIVERINETNGVIIQQLINPEYKKVLKEPNLLIHFYTCRTNQPMLLNIGGARNEQIRVAKSKLAPCKLLPIYREVSPIKLTKEIYNIIKNG